jgi:hypothetical protein
MNPVNLSALQIGFKPVGDEPHGPDSALHGQLILAGCQYHITAILVTDDDGAWKAVDPQYTSEVEALYELSGSDLTTSEIDGKPYLLAIFSHGS